VHDASCKNYNYFIVRLIIKNIAICNPTFLLDFLSRKENPANENGLKWTEILFILFVSNPDADLLNPFLPN